MAREAVVAMSETPEHVAGHVDALFVQSAAALTSREDTITLQGLSEATVYFADRPRREVGHIPSHRFVELWREGEDSFVVHPPHAVLSILDDDGTASADDVVMVLKEPRIDGDAVTYTVDVLQGTLPAESGPCSLFIDALDRPLAPALLADDAPARPGT